MTPTVYIDPGVDYFAWCLFADNRLEVAGYDPRGHIAEVAKYACRVVIEKPFVQQEAHRRSAGQRSSNKTIQELCIAAGEYAGHFPDRTYLFPYMTPKLIRHARALAALSPAEVVKLPKYKTHMKHVGCALYIGMRDTGRIRA